MTKKRRTFIIVLAVLLLVGGAFAIKEFRAATLRVEVFPVAMLDMVTMEDSLSIDASISDTDSQSIYPDPTQTIVEVYVTRGQQVKAGDRLMAYDMTSQSIALQLKQLEVESAKKSLQTARDELQTLKAGGSLGAASTDMILIGKTGSSAAASAPPVMEGTEAAPIYAAPAGTKNKEAWTSLDGSRFEDYYNKQDAAAGTETTPRKYLVTEDALIYGSFFNALGDREDCYALIEVRSGNTASGKLISSWMIHSGELTYRDPEDAWRVMDHQPAEEEPEGYEYPDDYEEDPDWTDSDPGGSPYDRGRAIRAKEQEIRSLDLDMRKAMQELKAMQDQVKDGVVYSKKDGIVTIVNDKDDPPRDGSPFLKVSAGSGISMKGYVSELMLDRVKVGSPVMAMDMENGNMYEGKVTSLDDYPSSDETMYYGGNPNSSYYGFMAYFEDAADVRPDAWLQLSLEGTGESTEGAICLPKAYIRTEGQKNYVMKEEKGVLVRQTIRCGKTYYGEYTQVLEGLSYEDFISFPYGDGAKTGTRTKETDEMEGLG